jgi:inosose dehydratase
VFTVPGDGSVAFERVFRELRHYSGWVILEAEQDPRIADPMTYASIGYNNLRRLLSESAP